MMGLTHELKYARQFHSTLTACAVRHYKLIAFCCYFIADPYNVTPTIQYVVHMSVVCNVLY